MTSPQNGDGLPMSDTSSQLLAEIPYGELVLRLGLGWIACTDAQPWNDCRSTLLYVVYSPSYGGVQLICRFKLSGAACWWHEGMQVGISGVTHWRLAREVDRDFSDIEGPIPNATEVAAEDLDLLRRWWVWFCDYKGLGPA